MKLAKIHIKNFRSIQNSEIRFDEITALVGENNAGKSAILRAINAIFNWNNHILSIILINTLPKQQPLLFYIFRISLSKSILIFAMLTN